MSYVFLQSNLEKYEFLKVHIFCQILCFIFKCFDIKKIPFELIRTQKELTRIIIF
jgi:formate hydrogenlyase subunit 4